MLQLRTKKRRGGRVVLGCVAFVLLAGGLYLLSLTFAPVIAPVLVTKPINVNSLPQPSVGQNRIIIPKIGVDIPYGQGAAALDRGAEWRDPDHGSPETGGNFIIAAHRFSIQPTPMGTIEKSPFYNIDKLVIGDKIIVDFNGKRFGYEINKIFSVKPSQTEIEQRTASPQLTLYSCELGGADAGRVVLNATPLGEVALSSDTN